MKKINKKDALNLLILTVFFIGIIIFFIKDNTLYGAAGDWVSQHSSIPEYFRTLFYKTFNIFPNFAQNLGAGQNIYNYAYYGLLNPVITISYLLPFVSMKTFIQASSIITVYISVILFYNFLRSNKYSENIFLLGTLSFMLSASLIYHSQKHIMFINYMPFLILALFGVDKYFKNNNKVLLSISVLLIALMSFYYSIPSIICIVIYGVYKYITMNKSTNLKTFMKDGIKFVLPIFIGILTASILLVPVFMALLNGRMSTTTNISILDLVIPSINTKYLMYSSYGVGLTSISLISLLILFLTKKKENIFLSIILSCMIIFPIFNYILNATMYIDSKVLIPFLPLYVLAIAEAIKYIHEKRISITLLSVISILILLLVFITKKSYNNYFYIDYLLTLTLIITIILTKKRQVCLILLIVLTAITGTLTLSFSPNKLVKYDKYYNSSNINQKELSSKIKNDYNHTALFNNNHDNVNSINENINIYSNYIYSSIGNLSYNKFYYDVFENNITYRNRALVTANQNIMYLMFSNTKYFISEETDIVGYKETDRIGNTILYQNDDVLPFMYVSYKYMSEKDFNTYLFPYTNEILLNKTIIKGEALDDYETRIKTIDLNDFVIADVSENIVINNNVITSNKNNSIVNIELPNELKDKILFISFDIEPQSCEIGDLSIQINNIKNKLTCSEWKYYNGNTTFNYVLSEAFKGSLNLTFSKGTFVISNIKAHYISYDDIKDVNNHVTPAVINKKTSGDNYYASVDAIKDGYFVTSIPYDKGFTIKVDGKKVDIETVNTAFIGFKISKGLHEIEINYTAPGKRIGSLFSIIGIVSFILLCIKRKEKSKH